LREIPDRRALAGVLRADFRKETIMQNIFSKNIGVKLTLFCLLSILAIWVIPKLDPSTEGPGSITVLGVGLVMTLFTAGVIYFGANTSLNLPKKFFLFAFLYNALIITVKFVISPLSVYQTNQLRPFGFQLNNDALTLAMIAAVVFLLYFAVFSGIYLYFKHKVEKSIPQDAVPVEKTKGHKALVFWGIALLVGVIILVGGGSIFAFPLIFSLFSFEYLGFVFSGVFGILIALALLGAIYFVTGAFRSAAEQAIIMRDVTILVSFFWIGAAFLFIYHALWVVYLLILTALWPLRVVVPK